MSRLTRAMEERLFKVPAAIGPRGKGARGCGYHTGEVVNFGENGSVIARPKDYEEAAPLRAAPTIRSGTH
jgi:hypothetical protein